MDFSYNDAIGGIPDYVKSREWYTDDFRSYLNKLSKNVRNISTHIAKKFYWQGTGSLKSRNIGLRRPIDTNTHWNKELIEWIDHNLYEGDYPGIHAGDRMPTKELVLVEPKYTDRRVIYRIFQISMRVSFDEFSEWINADLSPKDGYPNTPKNRVIPYKVYNQFILYLAESSVKNSISEITEDDLDRFINVMRSNKNSINDGVLNQKLNVLFSNKELAKVYEKSFRNIKHLDFSCNDLILVDRARSWYSKYIQGSNKANPWYF